MEPETDRLLVHCLRCDHEWPFVKLPVMETAFVTALRTVGNAACPKCSAMGIRLILAGPRDPALAKVADVVELASISSSTTKEDLIDQLMPILIRAGLPSR